MFPEDIWKSATVVANDVLKYPDGGVDYDDVELIAKAILTERQRCAAALAARREIYLTKMAQYSILDEDTLTRHEMVKHTVEALDRLDFECFGNQPPERD